MTDAYQAADWIERLDLQPHPEGGFLPSCLLQQPAKWILYLVAGLPMSIVLYTLLMVWALR